jgi:hypothetical protein
MCSRALRVSDADRAMCSWKLRQDEKDLSLGRADWNVAQYDGITRAREY